MTKYRKKTPIEAEQFDGSDEMIKKYGIRNYDVPAAPDMLCIPTLEGKLQIRISDWIATSIKGEHWAIADDVFQETYEEVE